METKFFEFVNWVVDNHIPKVAAKSNINYNKWIVLGDNELYPRYLTTEQLFEYWENNIQQSKPKLLPLKLLEGIVQIGKTKVKLETIPVEGMGATLNVRSDRYPYTIHKVSSDLKKIWISADVYTLNNNTDQFEYFNHHQNDKEVWREFILRKNGRYVQKGIGLNGFSLTIGNREHYREYYRDPHF